MILDSYKHQRNAYCKINANLKKSYENQIAPILEMPSNGCSECFENIDEIDRTVIFNKYRIWQFKGNIY